MRNVRSKPGREHCTTACLVPSPTQMRVGLELIDQRRSFCFHLPLTWETVHHSDDVGVMPALGIPPDEVALYICTLRPPLRRTRRSSVRNAVDSPITHVVQPCKPLDILRSTEVSQVPSCTHSVFMAQCGSKAVGPLCYQWMISVMLVPRARQWWAIAGTMESSKVIRRAI